MRYRNSKSYTKKKKHKFPVGNESKQYSEDAINL